MSSVGEPYDDLVSLVRGQAERFGGRIAARFEGTTLSYGDLDHRSDAVATGLARLGLAPGDRVAVMLFNGPAFLDLWFGCAKLGVIFVPLNTGLKGEILRYELADSKPKVVVVDARLRSTLAAASATLAFEHRFVVSADDSGEPGADGFRPFEELPATSGPAPMHQPRPWDPASVLYTSGTTGPPKGAVIPHRKYLRTSAEIGARSALDDAAVLFTALPLFHCNAQEMTALTAFQNGLTAAFEERFHASTYWEAARRFDATHVSLLISMINILYKQPEKPTDRAHRVRTALTAGTTRDVWPKFEARFGVQVVELYGMTECGCTTLMNPPGAIRVGSVGTPLGFVEAQVVDDDDRPVADGERGELVVRPREAYTMFQGYWGKAEVTVEAWRNLWFHTGDYVRKDGAGYYYYVDRKKDVIRRRGENVAPYDVETVVNRCAGVMESVAVGVPSEVGEEDVKVFVVAKAGEAVDARRLFEECGRELPFYMVPRYVEVVESIPKTANEKAQRYRLKEARTLGGKVYDREQLGVVIRRE